jgi:excinuclease ABC subunit A
MIEEKFEGFIANLEKRYIESDSEFVKRDIEQYMNRQICSLCDGTRLRDEALSVKVLDKNIAEVTQIPINKAKEWSEV